MHDRTHTGVASPLGTIVAPDAPRRATRAAALEPLEGRVCMALAVDVPVPAGTAAAVVAPAEAAPVTFQQAFELDRFFGASGSLAGATTFVRGATVTEDGLRLYTGTDGGVTLIIRGQSTIEGGRQAFWKVTHVPQAAPPADASGAGIQPLGRASSREPRGPAAPPAQQAQPDAAPAAGAGAADQAPHIAGVVAAARAGVGEAKAGTSLANSIEEAVRDGDAGGNSAFVTPTASPAGAAAVTALIVSDHRVATAPASALARFFSATPITAEVAPAPARSRLIDVAAAAIAGVAANAVENARAVLPRAAEASAVTAVAAATAAAETPQRLFGYARLSLPYVLVADSIAAFAEESASIGSGLAAGGAEEAHPAPPAPWAFTLGVVAADAFALSYIHRKTLKHRAVRAAAWLAVAPAEPSLA